jgi:hypothetical protein
VSAHTIPTKIVPVDHQALGEQAANLWFGVGGLIFGQDWAPDEKAGEPAMVAGAFRDYFRSKGVVEIPASWGLWLVLGSYTAARITRPTVRQRIGGIGTWLKQKVAGVNPLRWMSRRTGSTSE